MASEWRAWTEEEKQSYIKKVQDKVTRGERLLESEEIALKRYEETGEIDQRTIELFELYAD